MKTHSFIKITLLVLLLVGADSGTWALAQDADAPRHIQIEDYFALKSVGSPYISLDGAWVAYTVRTKDLENNRSETRLWMVSTSGGEPRPMTAKGSSVWSPNDKYLTFMAKQQGTGFASLHAGPARRGARPDNQYRAWHRGLRVVARRETTRAPDPRSEAEGQGPRTLGNRPLADQGRLRGIFESSARPSLCL